MQTNESNHILDISLANYLTKESITVKRFQSELFVFSVQVKSEKCKIFQVLFGKSDGSLYVSFPYFDINEGILSIGTLPAFQSRDIKVNLQPKGRVTSKHVKFAHHPDGEVHFSQKGKISTLIRKRALPLSEEEGHIFTLQFQGPTHFQSASQKKDLIPPTLKRTILNFDFKNKEPEAVKVTGRWYEAKALLPKIKVYTHKSKVIGPTIYTETHSGKVQRAFLIGSPKGWPFERYVLMVNCEEIKSFSEELKVALIFIAGFDPVSITRDASQETSFLCASYPASNYNELVKQIGSVDII